ncbi:MAG: hypothetical protein F4Y08_00225 [Caldilineaceae bacterium SB0662_bin_9]|uniref:Uncharacterized protein n=1 Tax=Caldilineaceae bacterium SB0662_bin_9 TaxID=2605258 RepID=A0A6B1DPQ8_9CHLR|nr:hypothetical protein [Caldilineaceae bacterium SB0662_bin_9]
MPHTETRRHLQAYLDGLLSDTRRSIGWCRYATLALWTLALLTVVRAANLARPAPAPKKFATE